MTRSSFEETLFSIDYHPNVKSVFEQLRGLGCVTALISGGFKAQADRCVEDLLINHSFACCEIFWAADGTVRHFNTLPSDYKGKLTCASPPPPAISLSWLWR